MPKGDDPPRSYTTEIPTGETAVPSFPVSAVARRRIPLGQPELVDVSLDDDRQVLGDGALVLTSQVLDNLCKLLGDIDGESRKLCGHVRKIIP